MTMYLWNSHKKNRRVLRVLIASHRSLFDSLSRRVPSFLPRQWSRPKMFPPPVHLARHENRNRNFDPGTIGCALSLRWLPARFRLPHNQQHAKKNLYIYISRSGTRNGALSRSSLQPPGCARASRTRDPEFGRRDIHTHTHTYTQVESSAIFPPHRSLDSGFTVSLYV